jgi:hypothetical protein
MSNLGDFSPKAQLLFGLGGAGVLSGFVLTLGYFAKNMSEGCYSQSFQARDWQNCPADTTPYRAEVAEQALDAAKRCVAKDEVQQMFGKASYVVSGVGVNAFLKSMEDREDCDLRAAEAWYYDVKAGEHGAFAYDLGRGLVFAFDRNGHVISTFYSDHF